MIYNIFWLILELFNTIYMTRERKAQKGRGGRILMGGIGVLFLVYGLMLAALYFFGTDVEARLTSYRQEMGERNEVIPNRYTYHFGYSFRVNGRDYSGTGQRVAGPVHLKPGPGATIAVKYLPCCPFISTDTEDGREGRRILVILGVAFLLLWFARKMGNTPGTREPV